MTSPDPIQLGPVTLTQPYFTNETVIDPVRIAYLHGIGSPLSQAKTIARAHGVPFGRVLRKSRQAHELRIKIARHLDEQGFRARQIGRVLHRDISTVRGYLR